MDEDAARYHLEALLWPDGPICPLCGVHGTAYALQPCATRKAGFYRCRKCKRSFTLRSGTAIGRSKLSFAKWVRIFRACVEEHRPSDLARELGITYGSAAFAIRRARQILDAMHDRFQSSFIAPIPNDGEIVIDWDKSANKIFKL